MQLLARDNVRSGHFEVSCLDIIAADARAESERRHGYRVHVMQGALTLWNMQSDANYRNQSRPCRYFGRPRWCAVR